LLAPISNDVEKKGAKLRDLRPFAVFAIACRDAEAFSTSLREISVISPIRVPDLSRTRVSGLMRTSEVRIMYAALTSTMAVILLFTGALAGSPQEKPDRARDEAAIRDVVKEYFGSRDRRDAATLATLFTADADQLVSSGEWRRGREELVKGTLASSQQTTGTRTIAIETIRFPLADVAIADGRYEITGGSGGDRRMWSTFVMARQDGRWQISAIRNMLPAPPAK
jgi:uncharacterized protein (TIGR02246 family)